VPDPSDGESVKRSTFPLAVATVLALFPALFVVMRYSNPSVVSSTGHFAGVAITASICAALAVLLGIVGARRHDVRAGAVSIAFTLMAGMLAIHGLTTPGILVADGQYSPIAISGVLAVPAGSVVLAAAVLLPARIARSQRRILIAQGLTVLVTLGLGAVALLSPASIPELPMQDTPVVYVVMAITTALFLLVARHAARTFWLTRRTGDLAVVLGHVWLAVGVGVYLLSPVWSIGFWGGHLFELAGFTAVAGAVAADLVRQTPSGALWRRLELREVVASEEELLGGWVRSFLDSLAVKDVYTREHTRRVASLSVTVAEGLGLRGERLRTLVVAALLHDVGKLRVPDEILQKAGPLTDEEFAVIKRHPSDGVALLRHVGGFASAEPVVLAHHERLDGEGYPNGLSGDEVLLDARILSVCDVYDALTSRRAYRDAWPCERALALLRDQTGTAFDPAVVDALVAVVAPAPAATRPLAA
jgi:HD-GYP domain-containing protein (c-di-GMP phosphodiesterase class II)